MVRMGYLTEQSAENPSAVKSAFTKYKKELEASPAQQRKMAARAETQKTVADIGQRNIIQPEQMYKAKYNMVPVAGDTLVTDQTIHTLAGVPVGDVNVGGGPLFGLRNRDEGLGWASMWGRADAKQKHFDRAMGEDGQNPALAVYSRMGDTSHNFAEPVTRLMLNSAESVGIPKKTWKQLDESIWKALSQEEKRDKSGKITQKYVNGKDLFVGFSKDYDAAKNQLLGEGGFPKDGSGALRTVFMDRVKAAEFRKQGFMPRGDIMDAVTEPELRDAPIGGSGFAMFEPKYQAGLLPHTWNKSYDAGIQGNWLGGTEQSIPLDVMFPDMYEEFAKRRNKNGELLTQPQIEGTFVSDTGSWQPANQKWLDGVSTYLENQKRLAALGLVGATGFAGAAESDPEAVPGAGQGQGGGLVEFLSGLGDTGAAALRGATAASLSAPNAIAQLGGGLYNMATGNQDGLLNRFATGAESADKAVGFNYDYFDSRLPAATKTSKRLTDKDLKMAQEIGGLLSPF